MIKPLNIRWRPISEHGGKFRQRKLQVAILNLSEATYKAGALYFWHPAVNWVSHNPPLRFNKFLELLTKLGDILLPFADFLRVIQLGSNQIEERHGDKPGAEGNVYAHPRPRNSVH